MSKSFKGTGVALVTPFNDDMSIDYDALKKLIEHVSYGGVDYLVVLGTTGEAPVLNSKEKIAVLEFVQANNVKKLPIMYGMGGNSTQSLVEQYKNFAGKVDAFLVVTPYYNRPNQNGLKLHYQAIADVAPSPILLYNVPKRTGINMDADTVIELSKHPNIMGIKEASGGNLDQTSAIAAQRPEDFLLISGDDDLIVPFMERGGDGVISVVANAYPSYVSNIVNAMREDDQNEASNVAKNLESILDLIFREGSPAGIKALLNELGIGNGCLRLPMLKASEELKKQIIDCSNAIN